MVEAKESIVIKPTRDLINREWGVVTVFPDADYCKDMDVSYERINPGKSIPPHYNVEHQVETPIAGDGWLFIVHDIETGNFESIRIEDGLIGGEHMAFEIPPGAIKGWKADPDSDLVIMTVCQPAWTEDYSVDDPGVVEAFSNL